MSKEAVDKRSTCRVKLDVGDKDPTTETPKISLWQRNCKRFPIAIIGILLLIAVGLCCTRINVSVVIKLETSNSQTFVNQVPTSDSMFESDLWGDSSKTNFF